MTDADGQQLQVLCDALATVEVQLRTQPGLSETLEKETLRQRSLAEEVIAHLVLIRKQIAALEQTSKEAAAATERFERSGEHTSELQSLMRISYAVFCLKKKNNKTINNLIKTSNRQKINTH